MPVVPTINTPQVAPAPLPGAEYQTPTRFIAEAQVPGEQLQRTGAALTKVGDEVISEATRQQINVNEAASKDYDTKLMAGIQAVLYGTPDAPGATSIRRARTRSTHSTRPPPPWASCLRIWRRTWTTRRSPRWSRTSRRSACSRPS
jgi:hypothetical protein